MARIGLAALLLPLVAGLVPARTSAMNVVAVVNSHGPLTTVAEQEIRDIFLGKVRVVAGVPVQPVQPVGPARQIFLQAIATMSEREFQLYWMRKSYEEGRVPPTTQQTADALLRYVAERRGAIAFLDEAELRPVDGVLVVRGLHWEGEP